MESELTLRERLLDSKEAANILGCTQAALVFWRRKESGPNFVRLGRLVRYRECDLIRWIERQTVIQRTSREVA
jgi:predicted DNA-binding transcriptional regulator AlpA